jgi:copper chaperone CopZ
MKNTYRLKSGLVSLSTKLRLLVSLTMSSIFCVGSIQPAVSGSSDAPGKSSAAADNRAEKDIFHTDTSKPYLRVDFQVTGVSCVTCIRDVARNLKHGKGIAKADVSIFSPHWCVVVIDTKTTNVLQVVKLVRKAKADVARVTTQPLESVPVIVLPKTDTREVPRM